MSRVLFALGLEPALTQVQVRPERRVLRHWSTGETWNWFDLGHKSIERFGTPHLMLHRSDLHTLLADAVRSLKPDAITLDRRCVAVSSSDGHAEATFENCSVVKAPYVIGADGIHSQVRVCLFGPSGAAAMSVRSGPIRLPYASAIPMRSSQVSNSGAGRLSNTRRR